MLVNTCTEQPLLSHPDPLNPVTAWPGVRRNQGHEPPELSSVTRFPGPSGAGRPHALSVFLHLTLWMAISMPVLGLEDRVRPPQF